MKIVLFIGVLIASILAQAENRCAIESDRYGRLNVINHTADTNSSVLVANFNEAIIVITKYKSVGACSPLTAGCLIGSDGYYGSATSYQLLNKVLISSKDGNYFTFLKAFSASNLDDVILAFDQLVKAGGCQP